MNTVEPHFQLSIAKLDSDWAPVHPMESIDEPLSKSSCAVASSCRSGVQHTRQMVKNLTTTPSLPYNYQQQFPAYHAKPHMVQLSKKYEAPS